jgi:gliding motility-associated-like protein
MRIKSSLILFVILLFSISEGYTQTCLTLGQNPSTSFPVCGTATFVQNSVPICAGSAIPGPCGPGLADKNPYWYRFTCYIPGLLGFLITPNNIADDYDWQLFDVTGRNPNDAYTDATLFVACNWSGFGGVTGASTTGTSLINCAGNVPIFSSMPTLILGHDYLLMISHYTNTQSGYQMTFTGGTAGITDPANPIPEVTTASASCDATQITVRFNKKVKCNTLALNGSDFIINPSGTILSAAGNGCSSSFDLDSVTLTLTAPLAPGNYTVKAATGSDGNTLLDNCDRSVVDGDDATFTIIAATPLPMGTVAPPSCAPTSVTLTFPDPVKCTSVAPNGSDFVITGPSVVTISSATAVSCNGNGETNTITLQFATPVLTSGNYQVVAASGSDGNTLIGQCNRQLTAGNNAPFTLAAQPAIAMGTIAPPPCAPSSVTLTFADPVLCSTVAPNGSDFIVNGPSAVTVISATPVNCNGSGETNTITIQFSTPVIASGAYQVLAATGSDGNTLVGQCNREVTAGSNSSFTVAAQPAIAMGTITPPPCTPTTITLTFADPINCNSVAANGSDFLVTGPSAVVVTAATAINCNGSGETNTITIQFSVPILTSGAYQVQAANGSDGNTLVGQCGRQVSPGSSSAFTIAPQPAIAMATIASPSCTPDSVVLTFPEPINCNSIAVNGSDFLITGPSSVIVVSATAVNCVNGETNTIVVHFAVPILISGNYQVQVATGSDGNTLTGQCNRMVTAGSTASFIIPLQPPLPMGTVAATSCAPASITINFPEHINCMSISPNGSEFLVTGPSGVTITAAGGQCNINPNVIAITIQFATPIITSGTYQVQIKNGADGNTLTGDCNRSIAVGDITTFTIPDVPPVLMDSLVPVACSPSSLKLIFDAPIRCSSVAPNGSDFIISGTTPVTITSATGVCDANGLTTSIDIQLASPVVTAGTYQLQLVAGSDGNTLLSECYRQTPVAVLSFVTADTVSAAFQHLIHYDCETDVIDFSHDGQHNVNQWTWTINGAAASTSQAFNQSFSASSQNMVQLLVSNGICSDTYSENIVLNNKVTAAFKGPDMVCPEDTAAFTDNSTGQVDNWQWTFGNGTTSLLQHPPAQVYPLTGTEMLYTVSLTVSNNNGCRTTATKTVKVFSSCIIAVPTAFTPNNDGLNDFFFPLNAFKAENLDFKVFNRWGQLVFHSRDWTQKWDGRINGIAQATNVYVWMLNYTHRDTKVRYSLRGTTTLIR